MSNSQRPFALAALFLVVTVAYGGTSGDVSNPTPPTVAGSYRLEMINGVNVPGNTSPNVSVDTGYAILWPSGYYEIIVIRHAFGAPELFIQDDGHWTQTAGTIQFTR